MADVYFYTHNNQRLGPFSAQEMKREAASGHILLTDTVWRVGTDRGLPAGKIRNLFPAITPNSSQPTVLPLSTNPSSENFAAPIPADTRPAQPVLPVSWSEATLVPLEAEGATAPVSAALRKDVEKEKVPATPAASNACQTPPRKGRASAGKGAVIVSQDGVTVKYRKKCTKCGHEDSSWSTIPIRNGVIRGSFYCIKCKKSREVEVHGTLN